MAPHDDHAQLIVKRKGLLTVAIMAAMVMQVLDMTIVNVSLPHMQATLSASQETISWVLTSYILAAAIAIPITGWLADKIGSRKLFLSSVALFVVASMLCGIAQNLVEMVLFRTLQGIAGAFLGPLAQSLMLDINKPSEQPRAMSVYGMGIMIGPIMGPILGGWLTEYFDWRWCFYVNVPVGAACLTGLALLLPEKPLVRRDFDLFGFALLAAGLAALQLMLDRGQNRDWFSSTEIWIEAGVAICGFWMFGVHIFTSRKKPLIAPEMLGDRNFVMAALFMFIIGIIMFAALALLPSLLQGIYRYPVMDTGVLLASRGIGVLVTMSLAGRLMSILDARYQVAMGFAISAYSLWYMTGWALVQGWGPIVFSGVVQGFGLGFVFVPLQVLAFGTLPPSYRTEGAAILNLTRSIGSSIGIAVITGLLARNIQESHADLVANVNMNNLPAALSLLRYLGNYDAAIMADINGMVNQQAAMIAYLDDFYVMAIACTVAVPLALLLHKPKRRPAGEPMAVVID